MGSRVLRDGPDELLNDGNWMRWQEQMLAFLFLKGCDSYVLEELPEHPSQAEALLAKQAAKWITLCVSQRWLRRIKGVTKPFQMWAMFEEHHKDHLRAHLVDLQQRFHSMRQGTSQSTDDFLDQLLALNDDLAMVDAGLSVGTIVGQAISGLNASMRPSIPYLKINASTLTIDTLRMALRSNVEQRDGGDMTTATANMARGGSPSRRGWSSGRRSRIRCRR